MDCMATLFALFCSWLQSVIDCVGCKPTQSIFPTKAMKLERFYRSYSTQRLSDYLTPLRLYDLCRVDKEGNRDHIYNDDDDGGGGGGDDDFDDDRGGCGDGDGDDFDDDHGGGGGGGDAAVLLLLLLLLLMMMMMMTRTTTMTMIIMIIIISIPHGNKQKVKVNERTVNNP